MFILISTALLTFLLINFQLTIRSLVLEVMNHSYYKVLLPIKKFNAPSCVPPVYITLIDSGFTYSGMSSCIKGEAAAQRASAFANNTLLIKLPPASLPAILLLKPENETT